jgi:LysM repeat protein
LRGRSWRAEAKRYGAPAAFLAAVTVAVLLIRSGLNSSSTSAPTTAATTATTTTTTATTAQPSRPRYYRIRAGETISDVALRFNTTVEKLLSLNPGIEPTSLTVGQRIRVG